jgi:hypothetical protein
MFRHGLSLLAVLIVISICLPIVSSAQWSENGTPVCTAVNYQSWETAVPDGEGGAYVVWTDEREWPWAMLTAQHIDAGGFPSWDIDGIQVSVEDTLQLQPTAAYAGDGTVVIAWISQAGPIYSIRAQKIDREGNLLWGLGGFMVAAEPAILDNVRICPDHSGGAVVAWFDNRGAGYQVYAQRISAEGEALWTATGHPVTQSSNFKRDLEIDSDGYGGVYLTWVDDDYDDIRASWVQLGGYKPWGLDDGVMVYGDIETQENPSIIADGAGGAIVCWEDYRSDTFGDIYAQKLEASFGSPMWSTGGVPVCSDPGLQGGVTMVSDGAAGAILVWLDGRDNDYDIYAQRLSGVGTPLWAGNGIPVCTEEGLKYSPVAEPDGNGGAVIAWDDRRSGTAADVYATRIDGNYNFLWPMSGVPVCTSPFDQIVSSIAVDDIGNAIFAWGDDRNMMDLDVFAQRIDRFGQWGFSSPRIVSVRDVPGDEGGLVNISWDASRLDVYPNSDIFYYTIWRSIDEDLAMAMLEGGAVIYEEGADLETVGELRPEPSSPLLRHTLLAGEPYYWTEIATVYSSDFTDTYAEIVPTLFDSSAAGFEHHYFQVIAVGYQTPHHWISSPDSGYSIDNLAPAMPLGLEGRQEYEPVGLQLTWEPNSEADLAGYNIYRGTSGSFLPGPDNLITSTPDPETFDGSWSWEAGYWYKIAAVDIHGNESPYAVFAPEIVTGDDPMPVPDATFLAQNYPNPFNPATTISFGLKDAGHVSLNIYDAAGRLVRVMIDADQPAGHHTESWDGLSDSGSRSASGVYFYRLTTKEFEETKKMILLR